MNDIPDIRAYLMPGLRSMAPRTPETTVDLDVSPKGSVDLLVYHFGKSYRFEVLTADEVKSKNFGPLRPNILEAFASLGVISADEAVPPCIKGT